MPFSNQTENTDLYFHKYLRSLYILISLLFQLLYTEVLVDVQKQMLNVCTTRFDAKNGHIAHTLLV
jgi:hypothetical protein